MTGNIIADAAGKGAALPDLSRGKRAGDKKGFAAITCWIAQRLSEFWDFIDKRQIDTHITAQIVITAYMIGTYHIVRWSMAFAERWLDLVASGKAVAGGDALAVIGSISAPWSLLGTVVITAVVSFYFRTRNQP